MRPVVLSLALVMLAACTQEAPPPVEPPPAPEPAPEPEPVKAEPVPEPAMGDCVDLTFTEGAEGTYALAAAEEHDHEGEGHEGHDHGEAEKSAHGSHVKHHFEMPEGKDSLVLDVTAPDGWTFEVAAGVGHCPHHGTKHGAVEGSGTMHLYVPASAVGEEVANFTAGETWYVHLANKEAPADATEAALTFAGKACVAQTVDAEAQPEVKPQAPAKAEPKAKAAPAKGLKAPLKNKKGK